MASTYSIEELKNFTSVLHSRKSSPAADRTFPGRQFGRYTVLGIVFFERAPCAIRRKASVVVECRCGNVHVATINDLESGVSSCGCLRDEVVAKTNYRHGFSPSSGWHPLYRVLHGMIQRCHNQKNPGFHYYGGRGIYVCEEWRNDKRAFILWALAHGWKIGLDIDRRENNGPYSPDNCRFVARIVNNRNTRSVHRITAFGETKLLTEWAEDARSAVDRRQLRYRVVCDDWPPELAIVTSPVAGKHKRAWTTAAFVARFGREPGGVLHPRG